MMTDTTKVGQHVHNAMLCVGHAREQETLCAQLVRLASTQWKEQAPPASRPALTTPPITTSMGQCVSNAMLCVGHAREQETLRAQLVQLASTQWKEQAPPASRPALTK